jgi:O-antigen/teichoic acid export membrane protein
MTSNRKTLTTAVVTIAKMMALLSSLAIAAVLSRLLDKPSYGAFRQIIVLYTICSMIFTASIPQSIYYFLQRLDKDSQKGFIFQSMGLLGLFGGLIGLGLFFGADFLGRIWHSDQLPSLLRVFALYPALMLPVVAVESVFMTFNRISTLFLFNVITKTIVFFVVVTPIYLGYSMVSAIYAWTLFAGIQLAAAIWLMQKVMGEAPIRFEKKWLVEQIKYVFPLAAAAILGALGLNTDKVVVSTLGNPEIFAIYSNGAIELPMVGVIGGAVTMTLLPIMNLYAKEKRTEEFLGLWYRSQIKVAFVLFPIWIYFMFFANEAIVLLFSRTYIESVIIFQIYLLLVPSRLCTFNRILAPLNKNWIYAISHAIQLVTGCILCYVGFTKYGTIGVAAGAVMSVYINILFLAYVSAKFLNIPFLKVWPLSQLWKYFLFAVISSFVAYIVCTQLPEQTYTHRFIRLFVGFLITTVGYLLLAWKFGMFDWREWLSALSLKRKNSAA